jgi:iron complex outermembrane receptor protein
VAGGTVKYGSWTYNLGTVFTPTKGHEFYASYSQGFELPDIGVVVRNATAGFNIGNSNLQAVKTDTVESVGAGSFPMSLPTWEPFNRSSDLGAVQSFNNGLTLLRTKEKILGSKAASTTSATMTAGAGCKLHLDERRELPQGQALSGHDGLSYSALKLTAYVEYRPMPAGATDPGKLICLQDYRLDGKTSFGRHDTRATLDLISQWKIDPKNRVSLGVENLLNRNYFPIQPAASKQQQHQPPSCSGHRVRSAMRTPGEPGLRRSPSEQQRGQARRGLLTSIAGLVA